MIVALILMFVVGKVMLYDTMDPDFFWHIRVAEQLHRDGIGPIVDQLSFASVKTPWTPYSWMGELGMKWVWDHGGLRGVVLTQGMLEALFIVLVLMCASESRRESEVESTSLMPLVMTTALCCFLALPYLSFRPVLAAIDLLAILRFCCFGIEDCTSNQSWSGFCRRLVAVIINLHIFAIFVPMWVGAMLVESWIERDQRIQALRDPPAAAPVACCCTPMLRGTFATIRYYATTDPLTSHSMIAEFEPMYRGLMHQVTMGWSHCSSSSRWFAESLRGGDALGRRDVCAVGSLWSSSANLRADLRAGGDARPAATVRSRTRRRNGSASPRVRPVRGNDSNRSAQLPDNANIDAWLNRHGPDLPGYPSAAADYVATAIHRSTGKLINEFDWGGYLAWKLPEYQVFVDSRTQLYTPQFWEAAYFHGSGETKRLLSSVEADAAIVPASKSRFRESLTSLGWKQVFHDDRADVLVPPSSIAQVRD